MSVVTLVATPDPEPKPMASPSGCTCIFTTSTCRRLHGSVERAVMDPDCPRHGRTPTAPLSQRLYLLQQQADAMAASLSLTPRRKFA